MYGGVLEPVRQNFENLKFISAPHLIYLFLALSL